MRFCPSIGSCSRGPVVTEGQVFPTQSTSGINCVKKGIPSKKFLSAHLRKLTAPPDVMEPYPSPSVLTVLLLSIMTEIVGPWQLCRLLVSTDSFRDPELMSPREISSMLQLTSTMTAVWPHLGMKGILGPSLFLILAARGLVRKLESPKAATTAI